jgi:hypothetical protein
MGLFDGQGMGGAMPRNLAEMGRGVGQSLTRGLIDPYMESKGFISEENRIMEVMKNVDLTNPESFSEGFRKIMEINPEAAAEFRTQAMPILNANLTSKGLTLEQKRLDASLIPTETGTSLNKAQENRRKELIKQLGPEAGNVAFRQEIQAEKLAIETAAAELEIGTQLWSDTNDARAETSAKIDQIETNIKLYNEAKNKGNPAAGALAENALTAIFEGSATRAASEIERLASVGSIPQRVANSMNKWIEGTKTATHYEDIITVLEYYKQDNEKIYNLQTEKIINYNGIYDLSLPENQLKIRDISKIKSGVETGDLNVIRGADGKLIVEGSK